MPDEISLDPFFIGRYIRGEPDEIESKRADSQIEAGEAVQLVSGDAESVETFDGSGTLYGVAAYSTQADQDFRRASNNRDRARYDTDDPVAVHRVGSAGIIAVEFGEAATEGDSLVVDDSTGLWRPASTGTTPVTTVSNGEVAEDTITQGSVEVGGIRLNATEA
jgi:hypothetical protein